MRIQTESQHKHKISVVKNYFNKIGIFLKQKNILQNRKRKSNRKIERENEIIRILKKKNFIVLNCNKK